MFFQLGEKCPFLQQVYRHDLSGKASNCHIKPRFHHINERFSIPCFFLRFQEQFLIVELCRFEVRSPKGWTYSTGGMIEVFHMIYNFSSCGALFMGFCTLVTEVIAHILPQPQKIRDWSTQGRLIPLNASYLTVLKASSQ